MCYFSSALVRFNVVCPSLFNTSLSLVQNAIVPILDQWHRFGCLFFPYARSSLFPYQPSLLLLLLPPHTHTHPNNHPLWCQPAPRPDRTARLSDLNLTRDTVMEQRACWRRCPGAWDKGSYISTPALTLILCAVMAPTLLCSLLHCDTWRFLLLLLLFLLFLLSLSHAPQTVAVHGGSVRLWSAVETHGERSLTRPNPAGHRRRRREGGRWGARWPRWKHHYSCFCTGVSESTMCVSVCVCVCVFDLHTPPGSHSHLSHDGPCAFAWLFLHVQQSDY